MNPHSNHRDIETIVAAAGNYVIPTDDLRPEVLHAASELTLDRRAKIQLSGMLAFMGLMLVVSLPIVGRISQMSLPTAPTTVEIHAKAASLSSDPAIGNHWALAEAFGRLRSLQANPKSRMSDF